MIVDWVPAVNLLRTAFALPTAGVGPLGVLYRTSGCICSSSQIGLWWLGFRATIGLRFLKLVKPASGGDDLFAAG